MKVPIQYEPDKEFEGMGVFLYGVFAFLLGFIILASYAGYSMNLPDEPVVKERIVHEITK